MCGSRTINRPSPLAQAAVTGAAPVPSTARRGAGVPLRIGDAERDAAVSLLGQAYAEGYLDRLELDSRTGRALVATTAAELDELRHDLPRQLAPEMVTTATARPESDVRQARGHLAAYAGGVALMVGIWLVVAVVFGGTYFWPIWPILGWGIGVARHVLPGRHELVRPAAQLR